MSALGRDLRQVVRGRVLVPGEDGFEQAASPWNLAVRQRVSAVVEVVDAADAAGLVRFAAAAEVALSTRATGHSPSAAADGTVLVITRALDGVEIDVGSRVARVGAGVAWQPVLERAAAHGLAGACGSSGVVGVAGYTLGGGVGWFARSRGYAAHAVRALEVVTADGDQRRVTAESESDLFWALRGGGGDFALVTGLEFELFDAPELFGGRMLWPAERAAEVIAAFREATAEAEVGLSLWLTLIQFPPFPQVPEPLRGQAMVAVDVVALGGVTGPLRRFDEIAGLVLDTRRPLDAAQVGGVCMEPTDPSPARVRGELLTDFSADVSEALLAAAAPRGSVGPLALVQIRHLGGALATPPADAGCAGGIAEPYLLSLLGPAPTPDFGALVVERQAAVVDALGPHLSGRKPFTYLDSGESPAAVFDAETLARLRDIKDRRDPDGLFRSNFPVARPLGEADPSRAAAPATV
ncbi:FAD-binding oxidoreductase [Nocardia sp. CDC160]|uniref:FAD-binding oxidoreductase n=1 Tax=Nocardia sp. CDC160 TaxID=3112166 RepID=UPI002DB85B6D|nr:FAD-binding oxidoreductase [Nocardia sp. CDC160]MEC3913155.1 FAD-binding oxidoreductase [Nocardia sp. CDC160]